MVFKKLFPKRSKNKVKTPARLKTTIHHLTLKTKEFNRKSKGARLRAMKALKMGNKDIARQMLIRHRGYRAKTTKYYNMIARIERHMDSLEEAKVIQDVSGALETSTGELQKIAATTNPAKAMELIDQAEEFISEIDEAGDLLAGDIEIDSGIDVEDELMKLETEMLMSDASGMPTVPDDLEDIELDLGEDDEEAPIRSRDKIKDEINKLKKELDL